MGGLLGVPVEEILLVPVGLSLYEPDDCTSLKFFRNIYVLLFLSITIVGFFN